MALTATYADAKALSLVEHAAARGGEAAVRRDLCQELPPTKVPIAGGHGFVPPPLDGSKSYVDTMEWHALNSPGWIFAKYRRHDEVVDLTWKDAYAMIRRGARYFAKALSIDLDLGQCKHLGLAASGLKSRPVVAVVANVESLTYFMTLLSLIQAGVVPFAISVNNSKEAVAHLIDANKAAYVLPGPRGASPELDRTVDAALKDLSLGGQRVSPVVLKWPSDSLFFSPTEAECVAYPDHDLVQGSKRHMQEVLLILHSSGSTSFPKAVPYRHFTANAYGRLAWYGDVSLVGKSAFLANMPPWHAFGLAFALFISMGSGLTLILNEPTNRPQPLSPSDVLRELDFFSPNMFLSVPAVYRIWSMSHSATQVLRKVQYCLTGGGPIASDVAYKLQRSGVRLTNVLGATEGVFSRFITDSDDPVRIELPDKYMNIILRPQSDGLDNDVFEILLGCNNWYEPNVLNETLPDGQRVYATKDLIRILPKVQPDDPTYFICEGRKDDQIMHSTGEKTNPGPLILRIQSSPLVRDVVYFGRERPHVGALVEPASGHEIDPTDESAVAVFRNAIWPAVVQANSFAPSHSILFKEMIVITSPEKMLPRTAKGSVRSGIALEEYAEEIRAAYTAFEQVGKTDVQMPSEWTPESALTFVTRVVGSILEGRSASLDADVDLFSAGVDSLNVTKIRNVLGDTIKKVKGSGAQALPPDFVYDHPTLRQLSLTLMTRLRTDADQSIFHGKEPEEKLREMRAMVDKYTQDLTRKTSGDVKRPETLANGQAKEVALVTGTTGGLGAHLLDLLVADPTVSRIYAVNRPSESASLLERQVAALKARGISEAVATSPKVQLVSADLTQPLLGLDLCMYEDIRDSISLIIHNSWTLNFNLALRSFEPHVKGTRSLIDLALASPRDRPPALLFCSSIGALSDPPPPSPDRTSRKTLEDHYDLAHSLNASGYGQSKAVTEHILWRASKEAGLPVANVRIGQLSGSTTNGAWAATDWLPLIVQSVKELECLPSLPRSRVSWLPTDVAAQILLELRHGLSADDDQRRVFHIVHPRPILWDQVFTAMCKHISLAGRHPQLQPFHSWAAALLASGAPVERLPTLRLRGFFAQIDANLAKSAQTTPDQSILAEEQDEREAMLGSFRLDTTQAEASSKTLAALLPLDPDASVAAWVRYWDTHAGLGQLLK
ncbi:unnamed protein product [Parajaminaea phylloscopi]